MVLALSRLSSSVPLQIPLLLSARPAEFAIFERPEVFQLQVGAVDLARVDCAAGAQRAGPAVGSLWSWPTVAEHWGQRESWRGLTSPAPWPSDLKCEMKPRKDCAAALLEMEADHLKEKCERLNAHDLKLITTAPWPCVVPPFGQSWNLLLYISMKEAASFRGGLGPQHLSLPLSSFGCLAGPRRSASLAAKSSRGPISRASSRACPAHIFHTLFSSSSCLFIFRESPPFASLYLRHRGEISSFSGFQSRSRRLFHLFGMRGTQPRPDETVTRSKIRIDHLVMACNQAVSPAQPGGQG